MHQRIFAALKAFRQDLAAHLDEAAVYDACRGAGHRWRHRLLAPSPSSAGSSTRPSTATPP